MCFLFLSFAYVFAIGFWARPLINNATISSKRQTDEAGVARL